MAVARFQMRARRAARRAGDRHSIDYAASNEEVAKIIELAEQHRHVVEIGTDNGWMASALAMVERERRVMTIDPVPLRERRIYLELLPRDVRLRIECLERAGEQGPPSSAPSNIGFLLIGSSQDRDDTIATFSTWRSSLAPGAAVVFRDCDEPEVAEAIDVLGIDGETSGRLFIWRNP